MTLSETTPDPAPKTLRDEFAMAALAGWAANQPTNWGWDDVATASYKLADAMMAERQKGGAQ